MEKEHSTKKEEKDSKTTRNFLIAAGIIVVAFLLIIAANSYLKKPKSFTTPYGNEVTSYDGKGYEFNGYLFQNGTIVWQTRVTDGKNLYDVSIRKDPLSVEDIPVEEGTREIILNGTLIYMATDPDYPSLVTAGIYDVRSAVGVVYGRGVKGSIIRPPRNESKVTDLPTITCSNATQETPVIMFIYGESNKVINQGKCVIVIGTDADNLVKTSDRLAYRILGVMRY